VDFAHKFLPSKRQLLLAALRTSERPDENSLDTSESLTLTEMEIDPSKCGLCESCARFCPTGALTQRTVCDVRGKKIEAELKFNPARCVKCDLCLEACFTQALKYANQLNKHLLIEEGDLLLKSQ
jgi:formate hydrogenlyase subunit 6/NADH:ubiquinone oxidoreductase subunit I